MPEPYRGGSRMQTDRFVLHRLSLLPFRADRPANFLESAATLGAPRLTAFIRDQGLAPLWWDFLQTTVEDTPFAQTLRADLRDDRLAAAAAYLMQRRTLRITATRLAQAAVPYAVFKGAHLRERLYADPALRPVDDIDVLVPATHRSLAIKALSAAGMRLDTTKPDLGHEVKLNDGMVDVDLHWQPFRIGRSRIELARPLLERRCDQGGIETLDDTASLLVMLVHPAFAKHVCGNLARLVRLVDLDRMIRRGHADWDWVLGQIDAAGLRTAAWSTLYWLGTFLDTPLPAQVAERLRPGPIQRTYLGWWIDLNLPARLEGIPLLVQGAFTLALHDRFGDAARAVATLLETRLQRASVREEILRAAAAAQGSPVRQGRPT